MENLLQRDRIKSASAVSLYN